MQSLITKIWRFHTHAKYTIGVAGPEVFIMGQIPQHMPISEALDLAAQLVVNASANPEIEFQPILRQALEAKRRK
jgi:hypothetical protein